jgi:hypothetical protein
MMEVDMIRERKNPGSKKLPVITITEGSCGELIFHIPDCELAEVGKPYNEDIDTNRKQIMCSCMRQRLFGNAPCLDEIEARANQLWEQAGKLEGKHRDFWRQAEQQLNEENNVPAQDRAPDLSSYVLKTYPAAVLNRWAARRSRT